MTLRTGSEDNRYPNQSNYVDTVNAIPSLRIHWLFLGLINVFRRLLAAESDPKVIISTTGIWNGVQMYSTDYPDHFSVCFSVLHRCMFPFTQGLNSLIKLIWLMFEIWCRTPVQHKESGNWCILYGTLLPADSRKSPVLMIQVEDDYTTSHLWYEYSPVSFMDIFEV